VLELDEWPVRFRSSWDARFNRLERLLELRSDTTVRAEHAIELLRVLGGWPPHRRRRGRSAKGIDDVTTTTTTQPMTAKALPAPNLFAARIAATCASAFLLAFVAVHLARSDLDPTWRPISEYALGPHGWLMTLAFAGWGAGPIALAVAVRSTTLTRAAKVGLVLLLLGALGPLLAAVFPMDPLGTGPDNVTTTGMIHSAGAVLGDFLPIGGVVLAITLTRDRRVWARSRAPVRASALVALGALVIATIALTVMMPASGELGPEVKAGWLMRTFVIASNLWVGVAAWATMRRHARDG